MKSMIVKPFWKQLSELPKMFMYLKKTQFHSFIAIT